MNAPLIIHSLFIFSDTKPAFLTPIIISIAFCGSAVEIETVMLIMERF